MFQLLNGRIIRRWIGISGVLALLAGSLAAALPAEAADPLAIGYRGGQSFLNYSTRIALKANPTQWDFELLTVEGGTRPYTVSMSNPILEIKPQPNGTQYYVYPKKTGTTIVTIKDKGGQTLSREVVVYDPSSLPLSLGALPSASDPVAVGQGRGFGVSGGKTPHTVVSANPGIARIEGPSKAGIWFVWGVSAGSTQITVTDAAGARAQGTVHVGTTKPLIVTAAATLLPNSKGELTIDSGNPPYTVSTSANLSAALKGNDSYGRVVYTLTAKTPGQASVTVRDGKGQTAAKTITIKDWVSLAFPDLTGDLRTIDVGQTTGLTVTGGTAPYTVTADNPALVTIQTQSAGRYTVTGRQAGVVGITAKDAGGATRTLSLTVRALPVLTLAAPNTLMIGTTGTLSLVGGAAPFTVTASGSALTLTKIDDKKYTLTPRATGAATVTVKDAKGTMVQKTISVTAPALTLTGDTGPLQVGYTRPLDIRGGVGPYTLTLSNGNARVVPLTITAAYTRYNITGVTPGMVTVTAKDSQGKTAAVTFTVQAAADALKIFVSSPTLDLGAAGAAAIRTLSIQGGKAPYTATVSGNQLTLTKVSETQYQMTPRAAGQATVTVRDARGATAQQIITVVTAPAAPKLQVSAPSSLPFSPRPGILSIQGGTAPYKVTVSNPQILRLATSGSNYLLYPVQRGGAVVTVADSKGQVVNLPVTVR